MKRPTQRRQIHIHKVDGSVVTLTPSEAGLENCILNDFRPARIFNQEKITIAGNHSVTSFNPSSITRIDLITDRPTVHPDPLKGSTEVWHTHEAGGSKSNRQTGDVCGLAEGEQPLFRFLQRGRTNITPTKMGSK
jgi:hypothetical protein